MAAVAVPEEIWSVAGARQLAAKYVAGQRVQVVIKAVDSVKRAPEMMAALRALKDDGCVIVYDDFLYHLADIDTLFSKYIVSIGKIVKAAPKIRAIQKARVGELLEAYDDLVALQVPVEGECTLQYGGRPPRRPRRRFRPLPFLRFFGTPLKRKNRKNRKGKERRGKARKGKKEHKKRAFVSVVRGLAARMRSLALKLMYAKRYHADLAKTVRSLLFSMALLRNRRALFGLVKTPK